SVGLLEHLLVINPRRDAIALGAYTELDPLVEWSLRELRRHDLDPVRVLEHQREAFVVMGSARVPLELVERRVLVEVLAALAEDDPERRFDRGEQDLDRRVEVLRLGGLPVEERRRRLAFAR